MCGIFDILEKKDKRLKNAMLEQHLILKREYSTAFSAVILGVRHSADT